MLVPGLNNNASAITPLATELASHGFHSMLVTLCGHDQETKYVAHTKQHWLDDIATACKNAQKQYSPLPLFFVAYSTGALAISAFIAQSQAKPFQAGMFLAPAFALTYRAQLVRPLTPLRFLQLRLPSLAPRHCRAHSSTSLHAYHAMYSLWQELDTSTLSGHFNQIPVLIYANPQDELVSFHGLKQWLAKNNLDNWQLTAVERSFGYQHLLVEENSWIRPTWKDMINHAVEHYNRVP